MFYRGVRSVILRSAYWVSGVGCHLLKVCQIVFTYTKFSENYSHSLVFKYVFNRISLNFNYFLQKLIYFYSNKTLKLEKKIKKKNEWISISRKFSHFQFAYPVSIQWMRKNYAILTIWRIRLLSIRFSASKRIKWI